MNLNRYLRTPLLTVAVLLILLMSLSAHAQMPVRNPAWVQVNPPFEGCEAIYSSATVQAFNYYGNYWLDVIGAIGAHAVLDGVVHTDTAADAVSIGSIIYGNNTPLWDELVAGAVGDVLTMGVALPGWAAPVVQTSALLDGAVHTDTVASVMTLGDIIIGTAGGWADLAIGGAGNILTVAGGTATWAAPVTQTSAFLDGAVHTDTVASVMTLGDLIVGTAGGWDDLAIGAAGNVLTVAGGTAAWAAPGAPAAHNLLDGAVHPDTVASVMTRGDVVIGTAGGWDDLPIGTTGQILYTADGVDVSWGIPHGVVQDMPETAIIVAGAEFIQTLAVPAYNVTNASDVQCWVRYRVENSQVIFNALSAPNPVADMVRYYWCEAQGVGLAVHICNDSQFKIYATVSFVEPY